MIDFYPPEFADVPYESIEASACAPQVDDLSWRGVMIRMPQTILIEQHEVPKLPICGFYQLPSLPLMQGAPMVVHVRGMEGTDVPQQSGEVVIAVGDNEPDIPDPEADQPLDPELWKYKVSTAFFHLNGQLYLDQPLPPGRYELIVSYGEARSNTVQFAIECR